MSVGAWTELIKDVIFWRLKGSVMKQFRSDVFVSSSESAASAAWACSATGKEKVTGTNVLMELFWEHYRKCHSLVKVAVKMQSSESAQVKLYVGTDADWKLNLFLSANADVPEETKCPVWYKKKVRPVQQMLCLKNKNIQRYECQTKWEYTRVTRWKQSGGILWRKGKERINV